MHDLDPQVAELLEARTPPVPVVLEWEDVLRRARHNERGRRSRGVRAPRWLLLAAAIAVPAAAAAATAGHLAIQYLSGGASHRQRHELAPYTRRIIFGAGSRVDVHHLRRLVAVTVGGTRHTWLMAPLTSGSGNCIYEIVGHALGQNDCGFDPRGRHPAVSPPGVVGVGTALSAEPFEVGRAPVWVIVGAMPASRGVVSVRVRFQDGMTAAARTNGAFFAYVVAGGHTRAGHRPVALAGVTAGGTIGALQHLDPSAFDRRALRRRFAVMVRLEQVTSLERAFAFELPIHQTTAMLRVSTTPARLVRMFGGTPAGYPREPVAIVLRGPYTIRTLRRGCGMRGAVCPVPLGRWSYLAVVLDAAYVGGPPPADLIAWLRRAPRGAPLPDLARLGVVHHDRPPRRR